MPETLDSALRDRMRAVLDRELVSEPELRKLFEAGEAWELILNGLLERCERELGALASEPESSLAELAERVRTVTDLHSDLDELHALLARLGQRAHEIRASWLATG